MSPQPAEAQLDWEAVQARDARALDTLCRIWLPVVLQWCRRLGGPRVDADAATQEVFIITLDRIEQIRGPEVLSPWLFGVTRRVLSQQRRAAFPSRWASDVDPELASDGDAGLRAMEAGHQLRAVAELIGSLPEELAEMLVLVDVEGRSTPDVLEITGLPEGTMRTRLRMARGRLRLMARARGMLPEEVP